MKYLIKSNTTTPIIYKIFLINQYKIINNKLEFLWFLLIYSNFRINLITFNKYFLNKKYLYLTNILHTNWLNNTPIYYSKKIILKKYNLTYSSILLNFNQNYSSKKLYITTCCYHINKSVLVNTIYKENFNFNIYLYFIKLLLKNNTYMYIINLQYLKFFNDLINLSLIKSLGFKKNNLIISTKLLINHNLKNL